MVTMELTEREQRLILECRAEDERDRQHKQFVLHVLDTAAKFEAWRQPEGRDKNYGTFLNEFSYEEVPGMKSNRVHEAVCRVLAFVWSEVE